MNPEQLSETIVDVLGALVADGTITLPDGVPTQVTVERPRQKGHGDYATNVAMQLAKKAGVSINDVTDLYIYGNHSPTMFADFTHAKIGGKAVTDVITDRAWLENEYLPTVGKRGAAIIEARGLSSAASAANAAIDHMRDWALGTHGKWVTMGIPSQGWYGIPKDVMFGFPVTCENGEYKVVEGLPIDAFSQTCIDKTLKELTDEQAGVAHLL